ncbi:LAFA_0D16314g1_1 [Lachancea sp. 'fantastica']|nr:LAFA_0D16314g1_1 [Lachancea sp. 'fantastica']
MAPAYDDDDGDYSYDDDVVEFQDEAALDDYMNDEEYELMNDMFPRAKKELADYLGWDNLKVKLAIFDHEFNLDEALIDLKRGLKKKKSEETPTKMSALEQAARRRALNSKKAATTDTSNSAGKLGAISPRARDGGEKPPSSLAARLASLQVKREGAPSKLPGQGKDSKSLASRLSFGNKKQQEPSESALNSRTSLYSKLSALRKSKDSGEVSTSKKPTQPSTEIAPLSQSEEKDRISEVSKIPTFEEIGGLFNLKALPDDRELPEKSLEISELVAKRESKEETAISRLKRKYDDVHSTYFPYTNNQAAKKQATVNFNKQSPDDVVMEAQKRAFEDVANVSKGVEAVTLENSKPTKDEGIDQDEEDDKPFPKDPVVRTHKKATSPTKPKNPIDLNAFLQQKKPHLSFVVIGHVDAGKSTLMGRLLYDVGAVDNKLIRKLKRESEMIGKSSFHLAWVMDQTAEERNRGVTVDICTSDFETKDSTFTIVDAPGHRDFVPNAIAGVSQVDVAVLSIDCSTDAFESGFNLDGQTKEHTILARSLGIRHIIVAMNKMDSVDWYEGRFTDIKSELTNFFEDIGIKSEQTSWIPCSGLSGEGVFDKSYPAGLAWYKGPSLVESLEQISQSFFDSESAEITEKPFLFSTFDVSQGSKPNEAVLFGRVESGHIQSGETVTIYPSEQSVSVTQILVGNNQAPVPVAIKGDFVTLKVRNAYVEDIQGGDLVAVVGYDIESAQEFSSQILTFGLDRPLLPGTPVMFFRGSCEQPARIKKLVSLVDKADASKIIKKKVRHLGSNQAAIVEIELTEKKRRVPLMTFGENKRLGRILLRKEGKTVAAGVIRTLDV